MTEYVSNMENLHLEMDLDWMRKPHLKITDTASYRKNSMFLSNRETD